METEDDGGSRNQKAQKLKRRITAQVQTRALVHAGRKYPSLQGEQKAAENSDSNLELCRAQRLTSIAPAREGARSTRK